MILDHNNTYTSGTTITDGVLVGNYGTDVNGNSSLGASGTGTTVSGTGTLSLAGGIEIKTEVLTLEGTGFGGSVANDDVVGGAGNPAAVTNVYNNFAALHSAGIGVTNIWDGPVHLDAPSQVNVEHGGLLIINGAIDGLTSNTLTVGKLAKPAVGSSSYLLPDGTVELTADNTYAGATVVNLGILQAANVYALGSGTSDPSGTANTTTVNYVVKTVNSFTVTYAGTLQLSGGLTFDANESLILNGPGFIPASTPIGALWQDSTSNTWAGTVSLASDASIGSPIGTNLTITGVVSGVVGNDLTKIRAGMVTLTGNNTFAGTTTVSAGILAAANSNALGASGTGSNGTTVSSGAALQLENNITVNGEWLTLSGSGVSSLGALENVSGNNSWYSSSAILLAAPATVGVDAGSLIAYSAVNTGTKTGTGIYTLTANAASTAALTFQGAISGTGAVVIDASAIETGVVTFSGYGDSYSGGTTIEYGTLQISGGTIATLSGPGPVAIWKTGALEGAGTLDLGALTNAGTFNFTGYLSVTGVANSGAFAFSGALTVIINPALNESGQFVISAGSVNLSGTLNVNYSGAAP